MHVAYGFQGTTFHPFTLLCSVKVGIGQARSGAHGAEGELAAGKATGGNRSSCREGAGRGDKAGSGEEASSGEGAGREACSGEGAGREAHGEGAGCEAHGAARCDVAGTEKGVQP